MQIRQISAALDHKLAQLDKQLKTLEQEREQQTSEQQAAQKEEDILALRSIRAKLLKSKDLAWRAHELKAQNEDQGRARQRAIGISLCIFSVLGAGLLILFARNQ
jgi:hypothetical protein